MPHCVDRTVRIWDRTVSYGSQFLLYPGLLRYFRLYAHYHWLAVSVQLKTKLGQDMRTVGQNQDVAAAAGIDVDRTRIIAIIISTIFAAWGQIISLQNIGTMNVYSHHEQVGLLAVAAILVGGASISRATNAQAIIGVLLFHSLLAISPMAGTALFAEA